MFVKNSYLPDIVDVIKIKNNCPEKSCRCYENTAFSVTVNINLDNSSDSIADQSHNRYTGSGY